MKGQKVLRRKKLAVTISMLLATSGAALAQDQVAAVNEVDEAESSEQVIEEVIVSGRYHASLIDAISTKMNSTSIVEAISAEDIGKLPDSSIAESLARLPGVAGERRDGRTSGISIRGFNENFIGTTMNGRELLGMGDNRGVEFDLYPSEIVSGILVYKTPDATQMTQGIGGIIDLNTIRPLDVDPFFVVNATYEQNEKSSANPDFDDNGNRLALSFSQKFADDTVGIALAIATTESPSQEEHFRGWGYASANPANVGPGVVLAGDEVVLGGHDSFVRSGMLERNTVSGVVQWAPTDSLTLTFDALYIDFNEEKVFRGLEEGGAEWGVGNAYTATAVEDGLVTAGFLNNGFRSVVRNDAERKEAELTTFGLNVEYLLDDDWTITFDGARSESDKTITNIESYSGVGRAGLLSQGPGSLRSWVMTPSGIMFGAPPSGTNPDLTDFNMVRLAGPQSWGGGMASVGRFADVTLPDGSVIGAPQAQDGFVNQPVFNEELTALRLDLTRDLDFSIFQEVSFGANYTDRSKTKDNRGAFLTSSTWPNDGLIPEEFRVGTANLGFIGIDGVVAYNSLRMFDSGFYIATDAQLLETGRFGDSYTIDEELLTLYAKLDFDVDVGPGTLYGNIGLQYIDVDQAGRGFSAQTGPDRTVEKTPIKGGASYSDVLPSLNMNYDLGNGHLFRAAVSKTLSRPRMDQLKPNQVVSFFFNLSSINSTDPENSAWSGSSGNAALRPLEADQFDLAYDWYFADDGFVSVAYFYKDLVNWHRSGSFIADFSELFIPGFHQVDDENGNPVTPATMEGLVNFTEDGLTGSVNGYELQTVLPLRMVWDKLDGFGVIASATFIDGGLDDGTNVPGLSDESYALTVFYEKAGFSIRVSGTKRDKFSTETRGLSLSLVQTFDQGSELVDAQISYDFGHDGRTDWLGGLSLSLQGQNLTDESIIQTNDDAREVTRYQSFGANYLLSAIYKF